MKKLFLAALLLLASVGFSSCETERHFEQNLYDVLVGRVWGGDLGFYQDGNSHLPLDSYVYFGDNGIGYDELHYADNNQYLDTLPMVWQAHRDGTIWINYERDYPREIRGAFYRDGIIYGELYIDDRYYGSTRLYMQ